MEQVITNVRVATMDKSVAGNYGVIDDAVVVISEGKITWVGPRVHDRKDDRKKGRKNGHKDDSHGIDGQGGWLTPGLIDCHTHLIYGGNRALEWQSRLEGASYEEIARAGGGILSTVKATRAARPDALLASAQKRLDILMSEGVTCVEIKSGYGLQAATERKMLEVAAQLEENNPVKICKTFLGAHALPAEFAGRSDDYIEVIVEEMLPALARDHLVDAVDVFCEGIGFSRQQCERVFKCSKKLGLPVKGHVEQLSNLSGARLVAEYGGLSVDHLEYLAESDIPFLKASGVVAVLLPGAYYFLGETRRPPVEKLRGADVPVAIATDLNPGSSPLCSLLLAMNMACVQFALTPEEALAGVTRNAAAALGLHESKGLIRAGMDADLVLWQIDHPAELSYAVNMSKPVHSWVGGEIVQRR